MWGVGRLVQGELALRALPQMGLTPPPASELPEKVMENLRWSS